jgi:DNA-binding response OmpR family regulator
MPRALVVEDSPEYVELISAALTADGFEIDVAADGDQGVELARSRRPDVVILDLSLPGVDGVEVCRRIRTFSDAYVVMVTARESEVDRLIGLSVGADDYLTKPFFPRELAARVQAMLRRPRAGAADPGAGGIRVFGQLTVDPAAREVTLGGVPVELSKTEYDLLDVLSENPRLTLSRTQLLDRVWGTNWFGDDHVIDVHVSNLRRKLGDDPRDPTYIRTVRGFGFRIGSG